MSFLSCLRFRVRRWHTAMRGWDERDVRVLVCLEEDVWYWALTEWFVEDVVTGFCDVLGRFKFPEFVLNWEHAWGDGDPDLNPDHEVSKFREYWGEYLCCFWHVYVESPLFDWVWKRKIGTKTDPEFEMTLDEAKSKFAHDPSVWQWVEERVAEHKRWDAEEAAEKQEAAE